MKKISVIIILISFLGIIVIIANNRYDQINSVLKNRKIEISENRNFQKISGNNNKKEAGGHPSVSFLLNNDEKIHCSAFS